MAEKFENVTNAFFAYANEHPAQPAIVHARGSVSFGQLAREVRQMAGYYADRGIGPGDRVLVFVPMSLDLYRSVLALFATGATAVFVDEWSDAHRLEQACQLAGCRAFLGGWKAQILAWLKPSLRHIPHRLKPTGYKKAKGINSLFQAQPDSEALITFTTGSTGTPKGAQRTHGFLGAQLSAIAAAIRPQAGQIAFSTLPIVPFIFLSTGMTTVLPEFNTRKLATLHPGKLADQLNRTCVELLITSPFVAMSLANCKKDYPTLAQLYVGGAAVFPEMARQLCQAFPSAQVDIVYGSTEAEPISLVSAASLMNSSRDKGLLVGRVHDSIKLRIMSLHDPPDQFENSTLMNRASFAVNVVGEVVVAGDHVLSNYLGDPKNWMSNKIQVNGKLWHRTGDSGFLDESDQLWLTGRCKQLIFLPGDRMIAPFVIEAQLAGLEGVKEGTVISDDGGLQVYIVPDNTIDERKRRDLRKQVESILEAETFGWHELHELPKDPRHHSKIDYARLKMN